MEAHGVSKAFGRRSVLRAVECAVLEGECVALTGANGSGKTTLLRCLAGLLRPTAGRIAWFGRPAGGDPAARRLLGMVAHDTGLYPHLTLRENLLFAARMSDVPQPVVQADRWLAQTGLERRADDFPTQISRGMRQRLAIGRAVIHQPPILLLDEPFTGLDAAGSAWLLELLRDLHSSGRTICFVTHDQRPVAQLAQRVLHLEQGRLETRTNLDQAPQGQRAAA